MSRLRADHIYMKKQAAKLWQQSQLLRQQFTRIDREITNLRNAWAGDDELHFHARWQEVKAENGTFQQTERGLLDCAEHLLYAAGLYREAQINSVNAALELIK